MNSRSSFLRFAVLITVTIACLGARAMAQPKVSPEEQKAAQAIDAAPDAAGKSKAAEDFVKKFRRVLSGPCMRKRFLIKFMR